jgi:hypothetical protein
MSDAMSMKGVFHLLRILAVILGVCQIAVAQKSARIDSELVTQTSDSVWYDPDKESLKPSDGNQPSVDVSTRHSSIAQESGKWWFWELLKNFFSYIGDFFAAFFAAWRYIIPVVLLSVLGLIVFFVVKYGIFEGGSYRRSQSAKALTLEEQAAKVQDLPFELEMSSLTLLEQARKYRNAGDYSKAITYLFSHLLVDLDRARMIRLTRGKTNRVYLRELRPHLSLQEFLSEVVSLFETSFFGKHEIQREAFEVIWSQLDKFDQSLRSSATSPASTLAAPSAAAVNGGAA